MIHLWREQPLWGRGWGSDGEWSFDTVLQTIRKDYESKLFH